MKKNDSLKDQENLEPIAVIGIGCRYPGDANGPELFWNILLNEVDGIIDVPADRWNHAIFYHPEPGKQGKTVAKQAGFIKAIDCFDYGFFNLSPREASQIDPQHRILLEVSWEALEDAGVVLDQIAGSPTGVFMGISSSEYGLLQTIETISTHSVSGQAHCMAANRISFAFDFTGPSVAVDTACSSSLVAVHMACHSIWNGESKQALAGGVNIFIDADTFVGFSALSMLSADSRCFAFDERANGFVRSEGAGVVVLKPLAQAQLDGDRIYGVILGTATNQDGHSQGLTFPSQVAQEELLRQVYAKAGVAPDQVTYIEAHGTGTQAGDPVETNAIGHVLGQTRQFAKPLMVGSVKTNIGHLEAGAGIAGFIKACLVIKHGIVPANLHFENPNPKIPFTELKLQVPITATTLKDVSSIIVGVNSFGFGGTNAHVILSESPAIVISESLDTDPGQTYFLFILSARSLEALNKLAKAYDDFLYKLPDDNHLTLNDICYTAAVRRTQLPFRLAIVCKNRDALRQQLTTYIQDAKGVGVVYGRVANNRNLPVVFLFTGQGSQWWGMARELLVSESVFRSVIESCDKTLQKLAGWSLLNELVKDEANSKMSETAYAQPALLSIQAGLIALWRSWGVIPDAVVGHSVGEIAAAYAAGIINLEDAVAISFHRGRLMDRASVRGRMLAVAASVEIMMPYLSQYKGRIALAAVNSPLSLTISGDSLALEEMVDVLRQDKIGNKYLNVNYAFHSELMEPLQDDLLTALRDFLPRKATVKIISTVTGQLSLGSEWDASYWWKNLRQTVKFGPAVHELIHQGYRVFLEIGPHPALTGSIKDCLRHCNIEGTVLGSLQKGKSDQESLYNGLGVLHTLGVEIDWRCVYPKGQLVSLPSYTWQRERCWSEDEKRVRDRFIKSDHPLLGTRQLSACPTWSGFLSQSSTPYLSDHSFQGVSVFPASGYLEMALAAGYQIQGINVLELEDVVFENACFLPENIKIPLEFRYVPEESRFEIYGRNKLGGVWTRHATGRVFPSSKAAGIISDPPEMIMARLSETLSRESLYEKFVTVGLDYGPSFRGIVSTWRTDFEALGEIQSVSGFELEKNEYIAHPTFLDSCFQVILAAIPMDITAGNYARAFLPVSVERLRLFRRLDDHAFSHVTIRNCSTEALIADIHVVDAQGNIMLEVKGLRCQAMAENSTSMSAIDDLLYTSLWLPQPLSEISYVPVSNSTWLIFADRGILGYYLKEKLIAQGHNVVIARIGNNFRQETKGNYFVDPVSLESFKQLFQSIIKDEDSHVSGIAYLWGLDCKVMSETTLQSLENDESISSIPLIYLIQALVLERSINCRLWIVTQYAQSNSEQQPVIHSVGQAALWGIRRVAAYEHAYLQPSIIDIANFEFDVDALSEELLANTIEDEIILRDGNRNVHRYLNTSLQDCTPLLSYEIVPEDQYFNLASTQLGLLDNLKLTTFSEPELAPGEVRILVKSAGLNFADVLKALGLYPEVTANTVTFGAECSGIITALGDMTSMGGRTDLKVGQSVVALAPHSFGSYVTAVAPYVFSIPKSLSFDEAAAIPVVFLTAQYGLMEVGRLQRGERVLIHAASGGVGLAAIQIAKRVGAEIFATAGSPKKRAYLRSLGIEHVMDSRSLAFADEILELTKREGVDLVLNSLAGEAIAKGISILRPFGRFVEIGKRDIYANARIGLRPFRNNINFIVVDLEQAIRINPKLVNKLFSEVLSGFIEGAFSAIPICSFPITEVVDAFRYMSKAQHIGKITVSFDVPDVKVFCSIRKPPVKIDSTYLVTGGVKGFGCTIAAWLRDHGARYIVFISRSQANSLEALEVINEFKKHGCIVKVLTADVADTEQLKNVLSEIQVTMPPLRGIVHAAMVIDDGIISRLDKSRYSSVTRPKILGAWNLHQQTLHNDLDFFLMTSSVSSILGSPGQANYAAANAFLDSLAYYRRGIGLPALTINLGSLDTVGYVSRHPEILKYLTDLGVPPMPPATVLKVLDRLLGSNNTQIGIARFNFQFLANGLSGHVPPRFKDLVNDFGKEESSYKKHILLSILADALPEEQEALILSALIQEMCRVLNVPIEHFDSTVTISELGFDSLMSIELIVWVEQALGLKLPTVEFMRNPTTIELAKVLLGLVQDKKIELLSTKSLNDDITGDDQANKISLLQNQLPSSPDPIGAMLESASLSAIEFLTLNSNESVENICDAFQKYLDLPKFTFISNANVTCATFIEKNIEIRISRSSIVDPNLIGILIFVTIDGANWLLETGQSEDLIVRIAKALVNSTGCQVKHIRSFLTGGRNIKRDISFQADGQIIEVIDPETPLVPILPAWACMTSQTSCQTSYAGALDFVFVVHPRHRADLTKIFPEAHFYPDSLLCQLSLFYDTYVSSWVECNIGGVMLRGEILSIPYSPMDLIDQLPRARLALKATVAYAKTRSTKILGLGALLPAISGYGAMLLEDAGEVGITTGHGFTALTVLKYIQAIEVARLDSRPIAIVGAAGSTGRAVIRCLLHDNPNRSLLLIDLPQQLGLITKIKGLNPELHLVTSDRKVLKQAGIVVTLTNAVGAILSADEFGYNAVILDDAQPENVSVDVLNLRPDLTVVKCLAKVPGLNCPLDLGLFGGVSDPESTRELTFTCLAETILLAAAGHQGDFTIRDPSDEQLALLRHLAEKLEVGIPSMHSFPEVGFIKL